MPNKADFYRCFLLIISMCVSCYGNAYSDEELSESEQQLVIENIIQIIKSHSIYPELSTEVEKSISSNFENNKYLGYEDITAFAGRITKDLQEITLDKQIEVNVRQTEDSAASTELKSDKVSNKARVLDSNVGLIEFDLNSSKEEIDRVFASVIETDVLIIDLRNSEIGNPETVQYISSYLFDQKTLLNKVFWKEKKAYQEYWTHEDVSGTKRPDVPIYILTNSKTSSVAEVLSNNLKLLQRAYIVGEKTKGTANPRRYYNLPKSLTISIPNGLLINPISKSNWEDIGVEPDLLVISFLAFKEAYPMALQSAIEYRVKQGRGTPEETYSINRDKITYPDWQFHKGRCLLKYRLAEPRYNEVTKKYQFPYQVKYYGNGKTKIQYQLGNKTGKMTQSVYFRDRDDIKTGLSKGFTSHNKLSLLSCKVLS